MRMDDQIKAFCRVRKIVVKKEFFHMECCGTLAGGVGIDQVPFRIRIMLQYQFGKAARSTANFQYPFSDKVFLANKTGKA